jgi:hypothetical protein
MGRSLLLIGLAGLPYLVGLAVGFGVAVLGLKRWFALSSAVPTANIVPILRRVSLQYLGIGLLLTLVSSNLLAHQSAGDFNSAIAQHSLWAFPAGVLLGARWMLRRGER